MPKYFVTPDAVSENSIVIEGEDAKHIGTVLRARVGEKLTVCDGYNRDYECTIEEIGKNRVLLTIESASECDTEPELKITLFQALPKSGKMEYIIQKCTELGVNKIIPCIMDSSICLLRPIFT